MYGDFAGMYDPLMKDVDYDSWAEYLLRFLGAEKLRVTDCACGTGEITLRLARAGHIMTRRGHIRGHAEDSLRKSAKGGTEDTLCEAGHAQARAAPAPGRYNLCLRRGELPRFAEGRRGVLRGRKRRAEGGRPAAFDISSQYKLENILGCNTFAEDEQGGAYIWKNNYDPESRLIEMNLTFFERQGELYRRFTERHIQRAHGTDELLGAPGHGRALMRKHTTLKQWIP